MQQRWFVNVFATLRAARSHPGAAAVNLGVAAVLMVTSVSMIGTLWGGFELFANFRTQLAAASIVLFALAVMVRAPRAAIAAVPLILLNTMPLLPYLGIGGIAASESKPAFTVLTYNLRGTHTDPEKFHALLKDAKPDIVYLTELPDNTKPLTAGLHAQYPYQITGGVKTWRIFDGMLLSRWKPREVHIDRSLAPWLIILSADLCPPNVTSAKGCVRVVGLHAPNPTGYLRVFRKTALFRAADYINQAKDRPAILVGDFNLTPWTPTFATVIRETGLFDTARLHGLTATWFTRNPLFGLLIDHILVSPAIVAVDYKVWPNVGSDHFPVSARLSLREAG